MYFILARCAADEETHWWLLRVYKEGAISLEQVSRIMIQSYLNGADSELFSTWLGSGVRQFACLPLASSSDIHRGVTDLEPHSLASLS